MVVLTVITVLAAIVASTISDRLQKARLARCFADMRSVQTTLVTAGALTYGLPAPKDFWDQFWGGHKPGPYHYLPDAEDPDAGYGNELDGFDEGNPGKAPRTQKDIKYVVICQHDHGSLARYIYVVDEGPPTIADDLHDPKYDHFIKGGGSGGSSGGGGKGKP